MLEKMHFSDFNTDHDDDFKPEDIVGGDEDISDDEVLNQFK